MTTRASAKNKNKKPLETTLGKAPVNISDNPIDLSHLRKPIDTSIFGLRQVLQLYETATDEVRRYVTYECDIMYECRMCRTIFRSLANFILHKRNYCRELYNPNDHTNCRNNCQVNELHVREEEADSPVSMTVKELNSGTSSPIPPKCDSIKNVDCFQPTNSNSSSENRKNLTYVLRRLQGRQQSSLITEQCLSEDISNESKSSEKEEIKNNVALERINQATTGVFQTMFHNMINEYKGDMMKTEVMEIHNILENNEAILGSDGKIVASESEKCADFQCTVCMQRFSTRKTLTYHIKYKHNNTRLVYQCPECSDTYANAWSVFRHLYKVHRKSTAQVKRLRNQIHANIMRRDEQRQTKNGNAGKSDSDEISDLQEKANLENQWMDDLEGDNDLQRCGGCGRKFERKAALHSHSQFCSKRIAICNSIKENSAKRTQSDRTKMSKPSSNTNVDNMIKGSRRRKQLISQKMCRVDYVKDTEMFSENSVKDFKDSSNDQYTKMESNQNVTENNWKDDERETDIIEVRDDSNDSENQELVLTQTKMEEKVNDEDSQPNTHKLFLTEEPQYFSRSDSRSSDGDDVIYIDTIKLSPPPDENTNIEPINEPKVKLSPTIITRSMRNAQVQENLICLNNNPTDETSAISTPPLQTTAADVLPENEINTETISKELSNLNVDKLEQTHCPESNKRKKTEPQPGNSKRKKTEITAQTHNCLKKTPTVTLETKSSKYIDKEKHCCIPCKKTFKSHKTLLKHMALHFNWYRYQCSKCFYMSYSRSRCDRHVEIKHEIRDEDILKNTIFHVPNWKTLAKCTDFTVHTKKCKLKNAKANKELIKSTSGEKLVELCNKDEEIEKNKEKEMEKNKEEEMEKNKEEVQKEKDSSVPNPPENLEIEIPTNQEVVKEDTPPSETDVQDPTLRKMIMEVIFGNQDGSSTQEESEIIPEPQDKTESSTQEESEIIPEPQDKTESLKDLNTKSNGKVNSSKPEEVTEGFLGFRNSTEPENQFKIIENPTLSTVGLRDNTRPIRNRVPTVQKDFLYDMAQILKPKAMIKDTTSSHKEDFVKKEKQKSVKMCTKPKHTTQLMVANSKKVTVNKSVEPVVQEQCAPELVQDINMNSEDLKKHVTGDFC